MKKKKIFLLYNIYIINYSLLIKLKYVYKYINKYMYKYINI